MTAAAQRQALADLSTLGVRELRAAWEALGGQVDADVLADVLEALGVAYGDAAAALAADWFEDERDRAGVAGAAGAVLAVAPDRARWVALARWGVEPLLLENPKPEAALVRVEGGLQRSIADQHRLTVVESVRADRTSRGWRRVGVGTSCGFCRMLIDRGAVYRDTTVTFKSHDHCNCMAAPTWSDAPTVSPIALRTSSARRLTGEQRRKRNQATYAYIAEHYGDN